MSKARKPRSIDDIVYPERDGKRMSDNTLQFRWIYTIETNLDAMLPDDFVAGDLLWYPVKGEVKIRIAPDAMVCLGRPKGDRGSYRQWEEDNIAPQVVFEVLSPGNTKKEMAEKLEFYQQYGVQEYYLYYPNRNRLQGWHRGGDKLIEIVQMHNWVSPLLGIRFDMSGKELVIYSKDGQRFLHSLEKSAQLNQAEQRAKQAEQEIEQAKHQAEQERKEKEAAQLLNQQLMAEQQQLLEKLKSLGIDPTKI